MARRSSSNYLYFQEPILVEREEANKFTSFSSSTDEFDESDIWGEPNKPNLTRPKPTTRTNRTKKTDRITVPASLPVNIPDWSKILKEEYIGGNNSNNGSRLYEIDDEDVVTGVVIPPHELMFKTRGASFSVHEGIGRTLKGRDLSRVRNAIFEKTGFED